MSLPSQSPRSRAMSRAIVRTHKRRGPRMRPLAAAAVILVVGAAATWYLVSRDRGDLGPSSANAATSTDDILGDPFTSTAELAEQTGRLRETSNRAREETGRQPDTRREDPPLVISQGPVVNVSPSGLGDSLANTPAPGGESSRTETKTPPTTPATTPQSTPQSTPQAGAPRLDSPVQAARARLDANDPLAARSILNRALLDPRNRDANLADVRALLTQINERLVFSREIVKGDPLVGSYRIQSGDALSALPGKLGLAVDWRIIQQINGIADPNRIRLDQEIKTLHGPFHAVVDKSDYRLDLFAGPPDDAARWTYIRSFRVGLGEDNSTPTGRFVVKRNSKLVNPHWVNPRTGEKFDADDPRNPIGERWIGIDGLGADAAKTGYGLHGTIDPDSIGKQRSMGCVRLSDDDVVVVYGMLVEGISRVEIVD